MAQALRGLLLALGTAALLIALSILVLGPGTTAWGFERAFDGMTGWRGPDSEAWAPTMDSELRFYAPMFGAYGLLLIAVARDLARRGRFVPWLAAVFFLGGVGRAFSLATVGPPHPLFLALMVVELLTPPILAGLWWRARPDPQRHPAK